ncbi:unnamed protein product, partial [Rotaria sp. Silwood2]
MAYEAAGNP